MLKRPCAVADTGTPYTQVLCGDKFGDIYSLPLYPKDEELKTNPISTPVSDQSQKPFAPSASTLTVHSGANRKTLEAQQKQKAQRPEKTKQPLPFKHELLLGHVSMLTDVAFVVSSQARDSETKRSYIFSTDRDEHIRISRGPPQAHIIEGFCLGHKEFVNKLCVVNERILVSGGGDDQLFIWDWPQGKLLQKVDLLGPVKEVLKHTSEWSDNKALNSRKIAVSGLWVFSPQQRHYVLDELPAAATILIAVEGVPALFWLDASIMMRLHSALMEDQLVQEDNALCRTIPLPGNVLDVAVGQDKIAVSVDNVHEPGSTVTVRAEKVSDTA